MTPVARPAEDGFTLIEALIALAVQSITAVSFLRATEANLTRVRALEVRTAAAWAAQNRLSELALGLHPAAGSVKMLGQQFMLTVTQTQGADAALSRADVTAIADDGQIAAHLSGLVMASGGGGS